MNILYKIRRRIISILLQKCVFPLNNLRIELFEKKYILLSASVSPVANNWGDDASEWIVNFLRPDLKVIQYKYSWNIRNRNNYLCIGSIISWMSNKNSIIWGSGLVYPEQKLKDIPKAVFAVRGPLTREYLISQGIHCPEVYGDPALLFPRYYLPKKEKKYKIGIVPHFRDKDNAVLKEIKTNRKDILIIDVENVDPWHKFIDDIASCSFIFSSSLHGIIISDAYNIPNMWIEFRLGESKRFAFRDYYASIGRFSIDPVILSNSLSLNRLSETFRWEKPIIDTNQLINSCPFCK